MFYNITIFIINYIIEIQWIISLAQYNNETCVFLCLFFKGVVEK